jgi:hypothetical protein
MTNSPRITPWAGTEPPTRSTLWQLMADEGLDPYFVVKWTVDTYSAHSHSYDKVIYVVQGSITFGLPELGRNHVESRRPIGFARKCHNAKSVRKAWSVWKVINKS